MRVSRPLRLGIGLFNTLAACALAAYGGALPLALSRRGELAFHLTTAWGAALAAGVATIAIALDLATLAWIALGYLLWVSVLAGHAFSLVFLALALSLAPVLPRPRGSLFGGLALAGVTALAISVLGSALQRG